MARISKEMISIIINGERDQEKAQFLQIRREMPTEEVAEQMNSLEEALIPALEKNNLALLAYQVTGEGRRLWCFYTRNIGAFQETLNEALEELPLFPITFYAEEDREADAFREVESLL